MAAGTLTGEWWPTPVSCGSMVSRSAGAAAKASPTLHLENVSASPIRIQSVEVLRARGRLYVASTSSEGAVGVVAANSRLVHCLSLLKHLVIPYFVGKDARDLESLVDGVYTEGSNYKYAGMPFWNCVAHVELSLFDMLGKMANQPVGALVGKVIRRAVPVYLSSLTRETTPEEEVDRMVASLSKTNARAVKLKIGGRMKNRPRDAERTNRLVPLARKTFGDDVVIYVDSNGSYTSAEAIEVGRMLQEHRVGFFEEPCPWQEYEETRRVADALTIPVAGGEQDTSLAQFEWMVRHRVVDLVQPDLYYNGGLIRCLRVARMAAKAGINITPHSPKSGPEAAAMLHFASVVPNLGPHQEYTPSNEIEDGRVKVPSGPGLGAGPDPEELRRAEIV
jgi:L-alanine-DL-glutamate epimerase-like enolase superfamily enzyme